MGDRGQAKGTACMCQGTAAASGMRVKGAEPRTALSRVGWIPLCGDGEEARLEQGQLGGNHYGPRGSTGRPGVAWLCGRAEGEMWEEPRASPTHPNPFRRYCPSSLCSPDLGEPGG